LTHNTERGTRTPKHLLSGSASMGFLPSEYLSVRFIKIKGWKLATLHKLLQLSIIGYVVGSIVLQKGYQSMDPVQGSTRIKVKGVANIGDRVVDAQDLVVPANEVGAAFITTSQIKTPKQRVGTCQGDDNVTEACSDETPCVVGKFTKNGRIDSPNCTDGYCSISSWCPLENQTDVQQIDHVQNWTVYVQASVVFSKFSRTFTNAAPGVKNVFKINEILSAAGTSYEDVQASGGCLIVASLTYDCNLDFASETCLPTFSFNRIDNGEGFNYRWVSYSAVQEGAGAELQERTLYKVLGVRLVFRLTGHAGKFSFVPLLISLGAGMGLISIATLICDFILQYCQCFSILTSTKVVLRKKYEPVQGGAPINSGEDYEAFSPSGGHLSTDQDNRRSV